MGQPTLFYRQRGIERHLTVHDDRLIVTIKHIDSKAESSVVIDGMGQDTFDVLRITEKKRFELGKQGGSDLPIVFDAMCR
ncbi:hypothetical protein DJ031_05600 [bacterium endosymbiont of Escarpia laminata]|nr:MAG: hypothetical protein DJ031_05600 [bacterium endosymbiont of Escarpia laminata]